MHISFMTPCDLKWIVLYATVVEYKIYALGFRHLHWVGLTSTNIVAIPASSSFVSRRIQEMASTQSGSLRIVKLILVSVKPP